MSTAADPALEGAAWDLEPLVEGRGREGVEELLNAARERAAAFAERYKGRLGEQHAEELLGAEGLEFCRHHLRTLRRYRPHQLSEPEERIVTELDVTGSSAFRRLFTEQISSLDVALPDLEERASLEEALSRLQHPDRPTREAAAHAITEGLRPDVRTRAYVLNTPLADK